ncbi:MAG: DUF3108 domain-containing protein [Gammaproteobacteria bacterium]|nr:DUF3108 domain-containing protein [Gammaproteobacteria bacterium]
MAANWLDHGFNAHYSVTRNGAYLGVSQNSWKKLDNNQWEYRAEIEPRGLVSLFVSDHITEISTIATNPNGLHPLFYSHLHQKRKNDKKYELRFDWDKKQVKCTDFAQPLVLPENTQDVLSFQLYLMQQAQQHLASLSIPIATRRDITFYQLNYTGPGKLATPAGKFTTHKFESAKDDKEHYQLWLAQELDFFPVKIQKTEADGTVIELELQSLTKTTATEH